MFRKEFRIILLIVLIPILILIWVGVVSKTNLKKEISQSQEISKQTKNKK